MTNAVEIALEVGAVYTENAAGEKRVFMLSRYQLEQIAEMQRESCAQFCEMAAAAWADAEHRRVASILARGIRAMGEK